MTAFWGKTGPDGAHLPLERHLADAAAVAVLLFDVALSARQRRWLANALGVDVDTAREIVAFLAYAHDIGKLSPQFQNGVLGRAPLPGLPVPRAPGRIRHDKIGQAILLDYLKARGVSAEVATALAATIGGHHSIPSRLIPAERQRAHCDEAWRPYRTAMLDAFGLRADLSALRVPGEAAVLALAGMISVADWIASDADHFAVTAGERKDSRALAASAVHTSAWQPKHLERDRSFADLFAYPPRASQRAVIDALDDAELPALVIVEDRTGSGKTEAALWVATRALRQGARGLYVGLPTRATADQVHARVRRWLTAAGADAADVQLLHGGVHPDIGDPEPDDVGEDDEALAGARAWFASTRRGLLAPYGVGTIDQVLRAVLRERHYPVRFWGAAGKVVVIDEAHAYDAYTGMLLERLVAWLAALDCTVVLLSATLPAARRAALRDAYLHGRGLAAPDSSSEAPGYPRLTVVSAAGDRTLAIRDDRPGRTVRLESAPIAEDADAVAQRALAEASAGGCVAVVCDTVALAQQRFAALSARALDIPLVLLHARIRPLEREPIERALLAQLGPDGERPSRLIVVATQIIEQSLDLDFDVMLSDLAPIDLLIQRAGRVHRHAERARPAHHREPRLVVLESGGAELPSGAAAVYANAILVRTRVLLRDRERIAEPGDLDDLIEGVYGDAVPAGATAQERERIVALDAEDRVKAGKLGGWAMVSSIGAFGDDYAAWDTTLGPDGDGDQPGATPRTSAVTRWSERPSVSVVVLTEEEAEHTWSTVDLLRRTVSISNPRIVHRLLSDPPAAHRPTAWSRHGALRHHFRAVVGDGLSIGWEPVLGVCV